MSVFSHTSSTDHPEFKLLKSETFVSQVQDVEFIPGPETATELLAVALKNTNYLRLFDLEQLKVSEQHPHQQCKVWTPDLCVCLDMLPCHAVWVQEHSKVNMNAMGDDHVSFSASHLAASPCHKFLLVSTEGSRLIMFRVKGWAMLTASSVFAFQ